MTHAELVATHMEAGLTLVEATAAADRGDPDPRDWEANVYGPEGAPPPTDEELNEMARYFLERHGEA